MSGGSFNYLCNASFDELVNKETDLQDMANCLAKLGYAQDAAQETMETLLELRQAKNRIETRMRRLQTIWRAVEWWRSCDASEEGVKEALAKYRGSHMI